MPMIEEKKNSKFTLWSQEISSILNGFLLAQIPSSNTMAAQLIFSAWAQVVLLSFTFPKKGQKKSCAQEGQRNQDPESYC